MENLFNNQAPAQTLQVISFYRPLSISLQTKGSDSAEHLVKRWNIYSE